MDENSNKAIFNLMQKVVDKLDAISEKVNNKDNTQLSNIVSEENDKLKSLIEITISNQSVLGQKLLSKKDVVDSIKENIETPIVNNFTEYSLLGSKSHFKPITLILMLFGLVLVWSSLKYLPSFLIEKSSLSREKEEYELFYNYVYLKDFKNNENTIAKEVLNKIIQKDTLILKEYDMLLRTYQREIKKQELKKELKSLDNNDR